MPFVRADDEGLTFDEYGRPFIVIRDQEKKARLQGIAAQKVCVCVCVCRTTFGAALVLHRKSRIGTVHIAHCWVAVAGPQKSYQ